MVSPALPLAHGVEPVDRMQGCLRMPSALSPRYQYPGFHDLLLFSQEGIDGVMLSL